MGIGRASPSVLVVEDDYYLAHDMADALVRRGCSVIGPAADSGKALSLVASERVDFAILDLNLGSGTAFPVAAALRHAQVPFVFATGYSLDVIPADYRDVPVWEKPFRAEDLLSYLRPGPAPDIRARQGAGLSASNALLKALSPTEHAALRPYVSRMVLPPDFSPERERVVVFPESGLCSLTLADEQRTGFEVAMVGKEGALGAPVWSNSGVQPFGYYWQGDTDALVVSADPFGAVLAQSSRLQRVMADFHSSLTIQMAWNAFSGSCLPGPRRVARWILMAADRIGDHVGVTHAEIATALGVRRASVTVSLHELEGEGMVRSRRSLVTIRDRAALQRFVGSAYGAPERAYRDLLAGDEGEAPLNGALPAN